MIYRITALPMCLMIGVSLAISSYAGAKQVAENCGNTHVSPAVMNLLPLGTESIAAVQNGDWSDPTTWGGVLPQPGDDVLIPESITVIYDINDDGDRSGPDSTRFHLIRVDGTLSWATNQNTTLYVDTLFNTPGGSILIGTEQTPIGPLRTARIIIIADQPMVDAGGSQVSRGLVLHGHNRIIGASKTPFSTLTGDAPAGAQSVQLTTAPSGWNDGDKLVLGGTWFDPEGSNDDNSRFHDEVLDISFRWGRIVWFSNTAPGISGLQWNHERASGTNFSANDLDLYIANLTRNITIRSELDPKSPDTPQPGDIADLRRGHHMVMHTPDSITRNAAFYDFGRINKNAFIDDPGINVDGTPGGGTNVRGRYAFHHHRNLPQNNQPVDLPNCDPAVVTGCVVWKSPGWGFTHHDSYCVFEDNVAFDVLGAGFVQEAGNEIGMWRHNLSIKTTGDDNPLLTVTNAGDGIKRGKNFDWGFNGEGFWVQGASQVELIDNIAISAAGGGVHLFATVHHNTNPDRPFVPVEHLPEDIQYIVTDPSGLIYGHEVPANTVTGFEVYNSAFGLLTWHHLRQEGALPHFNCPCDDNAHREYTLIDNFRFWNIYGQGVHMQYSSQIEFRDGLIASSDMATPGIDDKPPVVLSGGDLHGVGLGMNEATKRLIVDNVIIEGWEFGVRTPSEGEINTLDASPLIGSDGALGLPDRRSIFRNLRLANNGDHFYRRQSLRSTQTFSDFMVLENCICSDDVPNEPPVADFSFESVGPDGVVKLSGLPARDFDTPQGAPPFVDGQIVTNVSVVDRDPNNIIAYGWDLDSDGSIDEFGERIVTQLPVGQQSPVTLTVWDHQGASDTITLNVEPQSCTYPEVLVNGRFNSAIINSGTLGSHTSDIGWFGADAEIDGAGILRLSDDSMTAWASQTVYNNQTHRGDLQINFDYSIHEGHIEPQPSQISTLRVRVWGTNSEFYGTDIPEAIGVIPFAATLLYDQSFANPTDWTSGGGVLPVGDDGFIYYMVSLEASGVDSDVVDDVVLMDNVSIRGGGDFASADIDQSGVVDLGDLLRVIACWGSTDLGCSDSDIDMQGASAGVVDLADLLLVIGQWGECGTTSRSLRRGS